LRKSLLVLILTVLILTSAPAMAGGGKTDIKPVATLNFTDKVVYFLDHNSDPTEGNWITLGCPNEGTRIQLPEPIKVTYNGTKYKEFGGASWKLNKDADESYTIKYPSTSSYTTHPVYLPDEEVTMSFHGDSCLKGQDVEIYVFKLTSNCARELLDSFLAGDVGNLNTLFKDSIGEKYEKYCTKLDSCGDISDYKLGCFDAGQYCIVMVQQNNDKSMTVLSSTVLVVTEYELQVDSPGSIVKGNDLDICMELEGAPAAYGCTYGAVLIKEQAYKANIEINSDGTKAGTSVIINDLDIIEEFDINSSNYKSKLTKNELQTEIQTLIGEGNGAIAIGESGQKKLSLTTFDLPVGCYYLLVGAYSPEDGLVGITQKEVQIKNKGSSNNNNSGGNKDKVNETNNSPEPTKNVKKSDNCKQFVTNGKRVKFEFSKADAPVCYLDFKSKKTVGTITATVEELKEKSSFASTEPKGEVYKYLNIRVGNGDFADPDNIDNAIVGFKVSKEWLNENHIDMDTIALQHFNGAQWDSLKTEKVKEDDKFVYFDAETPSFSPFAITASKNILVIEEKPGASTGQPASEIKQDDSELVMGSEMPSKETGISWSRITSFFVGFLVIILIGTAVLRKRNQNNEDMNSKK